MRHVVLRQVPQFMGHFEGVAPRHGRPSLFSKLVFVCACRAYLAGGCCTYWSCSFLSINRRWSVVVDINAATGCGRKA